MQEEELKELSSVNFLPDRDVIRHNLVVFSNGDKSLETLPDLLDIIPEASLNFATYHLIHSNFEEAYNLLKNLKPKYAHEYVVKSAVAASWGQLIGDDDILSEALAYFEFVGESPTEKDTIPGRQCMASLLILKRQYSDAIVYLRSIETYLANDDDFNWNYGMSLAAIEDYKAAEGVLLRIKNEYYRGNLNYNLWLGRCYIKNDKGPSAWQLFSNIEKSDRITFLKVVADESFQAGNYPIALKAFRTLQENNRDSKTGLGLKSSCIGIFYSALTATSKTKRLPSETQKDLIEALDILKKYDLDKSGSIVTTVKQWMDSTNSNSGTWVLDMKRTRS